MTFENDLTLNVHLGIYGNWSFGGDETFTGASSIGAPRKIGEKEYAAGEGEPYAGPPEPKSTVRCRIVSEHGWADLVGPTICRTLTPEEVRTVRSKLGPDPLNPDADPEQFYRAARKSSRPIGVILMDQAAISGVGNIFRAESLYRQEIDHYDPARASATRNWSDSGKTISTCWSSACAWGALSPPNPKTAPAYPKPKRGPTTPTTCTCTTASPAAAAEPPSAWRKSQAANSNWCPGCQV